jgi:hypothetical protein
MIMPLLEVLATTAYVLRNVVLKVYCVAQSMESISKILEPKMFFMCKGMVGHSMGKSPN